MPNVVFDYVAAFLLSGQRFIIGFEDVVGIGIAQSPLANYFFLVVSYEDKTVRRFFVNPTTVILEAGEPREVADIVVPETKLPAELVTGR